MLPVNRHALARRPSPELPVLTFSALDSCGSFVHGILTRLGGVSDPPYASLNVSFNVGDCPDRVVENRRRAHRALGEDGFQQVACRQVSGTGVAVLSDDNALAPAVADALVTRTPRLLLFMTFADCLPMILADPTVPAIALVHAGWRGTVGAISLRAWEAMQALGARPESTSAYLGPAIGQCCYEVKEDVATLARHLGPLGEASLEQRDGRLYLDLAGLNASLLEERGIQAVRSDVCTACRRDLFFSHRGDAGRTGRFAVYAGVA